MVPRLGKARGAGKAPPRFDTNVADVDAVFRFSLSDIGMGYIIDCHTLYCIEALSTEFKNQSEKHDTNKVWGLCTDSLAYLAYLMELLAGMVKTAPFWHLRSAHMNHTAVSRKRQANRWQGQGRSPNSLTRHGATKRSPCHQGAKQRVEKAWHGIVRKIHSIHV